MAEEDATKKHISLEELSNRVEQLFDKVSKLGIGTSAKTEETGTDVSSQIERALQDARGKDEAEKKEAATESRFKKLEELAERKPHSYSKFTRAMWGEE